MSRSIEIPLDPRPGPPSALFISAGDAAAMIAWCPNAESDIKGYHVYRDGARLNCDLLTETTFTDSFLTNGKAYKYVVTAVDMNGSEGLESNPITVTSVAGPGWRMEWRERE